MRLNGFGLVALAALSIWWFFLRNKSGNLAQGRIMGLAVDGAAMGAHLVPKIPGALLTARVAWTGATKNMNGQGITWVYRVAMFYSTVRTGQFAVRIGASINAPFVEVQTTKFDIDLPTTLINSDIISVKAVLQAAESDAEGNPRAGVFQPIPGAQLEHPNAAVIRVGGPVQPAGGIGSVEVSQDILGLRQRF